MGPNESNTLYDQLPSSVALPSFPLSGQTQSSFSIPNLSGLFPLGANLLNMWFQGRQNRLNREFSAEQSELAWQRGLEQWYRESAYNSPANQMRLLREAGLNPNLAYDQSTTPAESPVYHPSQYQGVAPQMDPMAIAQANLINAQSNNLRADTMNKLAQQKGYDSESQIKGIQLLDAIDTRNARIGMGDDQGNDYFSWKALSEAAGYRALLQQAELDEYRAYNLFRYLNNHGLESNPDIISIEQMSKELEITRDQAAILKRDKEQAEIAYNALKAVNGAIDSIDNPTLRAIVYVLYYAGVNSFPRMSFSGKFGKTTSNINKTEDISKMITHVK